MRGCLLIGGLDNGRGRGGVIEDVTEEGIKIVSPVFPTVISSFSLLFLCVKEEMEGKGRGGGEKG